ncbi:MAG: TetR/AcrR family transcriptional regulator [Bdellovibrionales bacterium]
MGRVSKKELLLDAAEKILENGASSDLSLDRIAEVSGISKGGLLYHFPTKDSVLIAMVERLIQRFDDEFDRLVEKGGADFKSIYFVVNTNPQIIKSARGLMAASNYNPQILEPLRKAYARWDKILFDQFKDQKEAWQFRLLFDGFFFCALLDLPLPSKKDLKAIVESFETGK